MAVGILDRYRIAPLSVFTAFTVRLHVDQHHKVGNGVDEVVLRGIPAKVEGDVAVGVVQ